MVIFHVLWNQARMAKKPAPPGISSRLDGMLRRVQPKGLSVRKWCEASQVSTSFFTDLRKGTEPGIDKIERLVNKAGLSLSQFIANDEAPAISEETLRQAIRDAFPLPPKPFDQQAEYLADIVLGILALPPSRQPNHPSGPTGAKDGSAKGAPPRGPTK